MEKPMQVTMVIAVPLICAGAFCATNVENKGESAITTNPQRIRKIRNGIKERLKANGEAAQQQPDKRRAVNAIFLVPKFCERYPPIIQAKPPKAIIRNDKTEIFKFSSGCRVVYVLNITGTNAQNAYNSHICPK